MIMATATTTSTPLIEWSLLGHVVLYSLVIAVGLVVMFSAGLAALSLARASQRSTPARFSGAVVTALTSAVICASLVWGLIVIVKK